MYLLARTFSVLVKKIGKHKNSNIPSNISVLHEKFEITSRTIIRYCSTDNSLQINYDEITNGDKDLEHKLKVLMLEAEVMRQEGKAVPDDNFLKVNHWKEVLNLTSRSARQKYFEHLFKLSKKKENIKAKKEERRLAYEEFQARKQQEPKNEPETIEEFALKYDLQHNSLFLRVYETTMNQMYNNKLIQAMLFGQKLVIDCGYDAEMTKRENLNCAKQLMLLFAENRFHKDPFDIHFCNTNKKSDLINQLYKYIPTIDEPWFPLNLHEVSYLDLYPKKELVYLTPHCREELLEFDHDTIYIVGAIVDKMNQQPLSLAKAKREGLRMAKLPLDRYLNWGSGSGKSLTLNQVVAILLDQKLTENWKHSLRHVPKRKLIYENTQTENFNRKQTKAKWTPSYNLNKLSYNENNGTVKTNRKINVRTLWEE